MRIVETCSVSYPHRSFFVTEKCFGRAILFRDIPLKDSPVFFYKLEDSFCSVRVHRRTIEIEVGIHEILS